MTARTESPPPGVDRAALEAEAAKHQAEVNATAAAMIAPFLKVRPTAVQLDHLADILRAMVSLAEGHAVTRRREEREREAARGGEGP
jgi:hypothetical protein